MMTDGVLEPGAWLAKVNARLDSPIKPGTLEDEKAFDAYLAGTSTKRAADEIMAGRKA
jgi:hypothetical protein